MTDFPPPTGPPVTSSTWALTSPAGPPQRERHATLPLNAAIGAVVVLVISLLASKYILDALLQFEWPLVAYVGLLGLVGYGPSLIWCKFASRRWGTGRFFEDVGLKPEVADLGWGPVVWLVAIGTQIAIGALVLGLGVPLSNNTDGVSDLTENRTYIVALVITAVIAAPFVEEIVFRGVVMRGLRSRLAAVPTVILQGVLFGVAHIDPVRGAGNIGLALILSGVGIAFGGAAYLLRRIGPTIVAHAIFNGMVLLLVLTGIAESLQN